MKRTDLVGLAWFLVTLAALTMLPVIGAACLRGAYQPALVN